MSNSNPLWITEATTISLDGCSKYRIVFAKSSDDTITVSDFAALGVKVFTYSENSKVVLTKNDVENNLTKGGVNKPLSAEAGKTIAAIADIVGGVEYEGVIDLTKQENFVFRDNKTIYASGTYIGVLGDKTGSCVAVIDVSAYQGKTLTYSRKKVTASSTTEGIIFFTGNYDGVVNKNNYIDDSGVAAIPNAIADGEYEISSVTIPDNAGYLAAAFWLANKNNFVATVEALKTTEGLKKDVEDLQSNVLLKSDIVNDAEVGGAQKALSAEAGKTLNKEVKGSVKNYEEGSIYEYIANPNHGYKATCANGAVENEYIPVLPGDTIEWFHGATENDEDYGRIGLALYDSSKSSIGSYSSNVENVRTMTLGSSSNTRYIRGSFLLSRISECYIKVNNVVVWSAKDGYTGHEQRITSLEESNENILSILSNIGGGSGQIGITHDIPQTLGELYCIRKAKEQINISSYLVGTIAAPTQTYNSGSYIVGIPYSSTRKYNTLVPINVSFETYLTALTDPNSYAYTRTQGFGTYANLYYGAVCGSFMSYCLGIKVNRSRDWDMFGIPGMERVSVQSAQSMRIGYIINCAKEGTTHVMVCIGVTRNNGEVTSLTMAEGIHPVCREREYSAASFNNLLSKYTILKYNKLYENDYKPDSTPFVMPFFNKNLMPAKGDKSNWLPTEDVEIDILNIGDYTNYVVYKDGAQYATASLGSATKINLGTLPYGSYSMVLTNSSNRSAAVKWIVVDVHMTVTALAGGIIRFSFSSANALPVGIAWGEYPDCYQNLVFDITKEDLQKGYKDTFLSTDPYTCDGVDGYEGQGSPYEKYHEYYTTGGHTIRPKMYFRTEFGTIATDWDMLGDITYVE